MAAGRAPRNSRPPARVSSILASFAYLLGAFALIIVALGPRNPFLLRHAQQAMVLHIVRLILVSAVILTWYVSAENADTLSASILTLHIGSLVLLGLPWPTELPVELLLLLGLPLGGPWILGLIGAMVAAFGRSLDMRAAVSAIWPDHVDDVAPKMGTPEYDRSIGLRGGRPEYQQAVSAGTSYTEVERGIARNLRDQRLERMWSASRSVAQERNRQDIIQELEKRQDTVLVRLDHLNHLLSTGSISMSRYNRFNQELVAYLDGLRSVMARVHSRAEGAGQALGELPEAPDALTSAPDADALGLAVIDQSGIPVITYGHFAMDESLISGMVSVMDGLSEEMFGSRANMTQLADGEVVYFSQGEYSSAFVTFDDEPSPAQVQSLHRFVELFEVTNAEQLKRMPFDPDKISEVDIPFRFARRLSRR
ncbi:MAG: hypothetical protein WD401_06725 [Thermomicrobiaceae bacterium]